MWGIHVRNFLFLITGGFSLSTYMMYIYIGAGVAVFILLVIIIVLAATQK